jgi:hypothetical protein
MEVVAELATYQLAGLVLDAGQQGRPVERARLLENTFMGSVPPWRLFGTADPPVGVIHQGVRLRPGQQV